VNDTKLIDEWGEEPGSDHEGAIALEASTTYRIRLDFYENSVGQRARLSWRLPGSTVNEIIPASAMRPVRDADGDGRPDICDIGDCNGNFVPDAIEVAQGEAPDCDGNGVPDACDLALGDCNGNGILDSCEAAGLGLSASYWRVQDVGGSAEFTERLLGRIDFQIDFADGAADWPPAGVPSDNFGVQWRGEITAPETGIYRFITRTDDGERLWIDGVLLIDEWHPDSSTEYFADLAMTAGVPVPFAMDYFEYSGGQEARLRWITPGGTAAVAVPSDAFSSISRDCDGNGIPDECDIADGAADANGDGVPDCCETNSCNACAADLTGDGTVNAADITELLYYWNQPEGDITGDGTTDAQDIAALLYAWGACP
jgi:hypothetical protein